MTALSRSAARTSPADPVRLVHLGLGGFHRAHQAWYTARAGDGFGIAAYTGRRPGAAEDLAAQGGLYTLLTRSAEGDSAELIGSISRAHSGLDTERWLSDLRDPNVGSLTLTITEAGYRRDAAGGLDLADPEVAADLRSFHEHPGAAIQTAPIRIAAGLLARCRSDAGPLNVISCDNLPDNGAVTRRVVLDAVAQLDPAMLAEVEESTLFVSSMVDRITPRATVADRDVARELTGFDDRCPVVTEPYSEWVLTNRRVAPMPDWARAGATLVADVEPYEQRKLWLLNAGHSLMAYLGGLYGHRTIADAAGDPVVRGELESLWDAAVPEIGLPQAELGGYLRALLDRFGNPRIEHRLAQVAMDGSQKIPARIPPVLRRRRERGEAATGGQISVLAAWLLHLRGKGVEVNDASAEVWRHELPRELPAAVEAMLLRIAPDLVEGGPAGDDLVAAVTERASELDQAR